jgi:predicted permease
MKPIRRVLRRLVSWWTTQRDEKRLRVEIEDHIARQTADNVHAGLSQAEARRQASLKFGGVESMKERYREQRGMPRLETVLQDARHALRRLRMAPAFTIATVLTLALGIGATTSIFTLVHAVLLKSLPVANPDDLFRLGKETHCCYLGGYSQDKEFSLVSYDLYCHLRDNTRGFVELAAFPSVEVMFGVRRTSSGEAAQSYPGEFVSGNAFTMFGISAYAGRAFRQDDDGPGAPPVAMMSYRLWHERYGADPSVIGSVFRIDDKPFTIVGITPPGFYGDTLRDTPPDFYLPLNTEPYVESDNDLRKYDVHWLSLIGRIRRGVSPASVQAQMRVELMQWLGGHWAEMSAGDQLKYPQQTLYLSPGGAGITSMRQQYRHWLQILMMVTGLVLLIVCANVANLMLVRGMERRRQASLSVALGAPMARVVRQPLIESILLSLFGGAAGLGVAFAGTRLILDLAFPSSAGFAGIPISASPSTPVLLFAFSISLITGVAFGIAPAFMAARVDPIEALRGAQRSTAPSGTFPRKMLVVMQAALSLVLLSTAGLLTSTLRNLENQHFGFEQDQRFVVGMNPRLAGYRPPQLATLYRRIHDSIASIPGVASVVLCNYSPMSGGNWGAGIFVDGHPTPAPLDDIFAGWDRVGAGFLEVVGTRITRGRDINEQDIATSRKVAVINEAFARKFFRGEDPIGKHFGREPDDRREFEIVGIAQDARYLTSKMDQPVGAFFLMAEQQAEYSQGNMGSLFLHDIVIRMRPGTKLAIVAVQAAMAAVDPKLPAGRVRPLREQVAIQFLQQGLIARLTSFFGLLSLVLAAIGLYGVTAYNAGRRFGEIGVRMALGAGRGDVIRLVLRGAFGMVVFGLAIGLPLTFVVGRFLGSQLYGMSPFNPAITLGAVGALGLAALAAAAIPAFRASVISPSRVLRTE